MTGKPRTVGDIPTLRRPSEDASGAMSGRVDDRVSARLPVGRLIAMFVLLSMVPLALLAFVTVRIASDALNQEVKARLSSTASVSAIAVQRELQGLARIVNSYANRPSLISALAHGDPARYDREAITSQLSELQQAYPGIVGSSLARPDGRLVDVVPATPSIIGRDFSYRDWYRGVTASGKPYVSEAVQSAATGHPLVVAAAALIPAPGPGEGRTLGILVAAYSLQAIQNFVDQFASSQGVTLTVTDQRGVLVASPGASSLRLVSRRTDPGVAAALRGLSGVTTEDGEGGTQLSAYAPVPSVGWTISASVPQRSAFGAIGRLRATVMTVAGLLGLVLLGGLLLLARTLRARRRAEQALLASEERTRLVIETANDAIVAIDPDGRITDWNRQAETTFGWSREVAVGRGVIDTIIPSADREARTKRLADFLAAGGGPALDDRVELAVVHRDGREFPVEVTVSAVRSETQVRFIAFIHDISERKESERETQEMQVFLDSVIENIPNMVFVKSADDLRFVRFNRAGEDLLGFSRDELIGRNDHDFFAAEDADLFTAKDREVLEGGTLLDVPEEPVETKSRGTRILHTKKIPIVDRDGRPRYLLGISEDITERRQADRALQEAKEEAERANRAKSEFLSRMSHELRTPLNAVLGFAQLLEMDGINPDQRESVHQILKAGRHLLDLINEVLDLSRIESGSMSLSLEAVSVHEVFQEVVDLISPLAVQARVSIDWDQRENGTYVLSDRQRLKQVVLNLLSNAVKYNRNGGSVGISEEEARPGWLRVRISDTGSGVGPEAIEQLFAPFARLGAERTGIEGTGLGLALSRGLATLMGAEIGLEVTGPEGSTFFVDLPVVEAPTEGLERRDEVVAPVSGDGSGPRTLLYIEDNLSNLRLVQQILAHRPEVKVIAAMQGDLGLELAQNHRPDLILLDLKMPGLPGEEVLRRLQGDPRTREIPVVVITADATKGQRERLLQAGAREYMTKPVSDTHLRAHETAAHRV
jgi:PAS domain S-box-containing protein